MVHPGRSKVGVWDITYQYTGSATFWYSVLCYNFSYSFHFPTDEFGEGFTCISSFTMGFSSRHLLNNLNCT